MIVPESPDPWRLLKNLGPALLVLAVWDVLVVAGYRLLHWEILAVRGLPLSLYGSVIGVVVGFRNNSSYGRWWEARGLWGQIVNNSRSLARQACSAIDAKDERDRPQAEELRRSLVQHQIAFVHALRQHLRGLSPWEELSRLLSAAEVENLRGERNVPLSIQRRMGEMLHFAKSCGWIDALEWQAMDRNLDDLADAQGGAERIKNTPMPRQYDYFPALFVHIYCLLLPMGMVETLGWLTPLGSTLVGLMFLALNQVGQDLEDPFDNTIHDVPMTAIATTIEANLLQILGEKKLPESVRPQAGVLW